jgi:hypothetical protein
MTIATAAKLRYGGYSRGSGASYAEGYVRGMPRTVDSSPMNSIDQSRSDLIHIRTLAVHQTASDWLELECDVRLRSVMIRGRDFHDGHAEQVGRVHGKSHHVDLPSSPKRLTAKPR